MRLAAAILCCATVVWAVEPQVTSKFTPTGSAPMFGTPDWYRKSWRTPKAPKIELQPPARLTDFVVNGKMDLSLRSYLDLVLGNFTDIAIERLNIEPSRNAVLRSYSIFDPLLAASFTSTRSQAVSTQLTDLSKTDAEKTVLTESDYLLKNLRQPAEFSYDQMLPSGTRYTVGVSGSKYWSNSGNALFSKSYNAGLSVDFAQPLLRGRGMYFTKLPVTIARSRLRADEYNVEDRVLQLVAQAENAYWDAILARENLRVQEQALALADTSLKRAQKELELGAISPLEIYQPEAQYKNFEIMVTQARYGLNQAEDALRRYIGADLDPNVRNLPISLTESILPPAQLSFDKEALVATALRMRPDLKRRRQLLDVDDLNVQGTANALKPDVALTGTYSSMGTGVFWDGTEHTYLPGSFGNAMGQLFGFGFPVYGFGLRMSLPIRDRRASADYADAVVAKRLDLLRVRQAEQAARLDVLQAVSRVESSRASVELARVALDLAQKRVDADQKRYDLGTITLFFLLASQTDLTTAQSNLVNQSVNYRKNLLTLQQRTGELLSERGISIQ